MSLADLDAFLAHAHGLPELERRLRDPSDPPDLATFLALAHGAGFAVSEVDVIAAQQRAEANLSDEELQLRAGAEARRLRHFIPG